MFLKRFKLFRLLGFDVYVDLSWFLVAVLVTWSLAKAVFPRFFPGLTEPAYWWMGAAGALGLFGSIVLHELGHSLVARRFGVQMKGITLFIFGGVAEMSGEPPGARAEFLVAIAGPIVSGVLACASGLASAAGQTAGWPPPLVGVSWYLAWMNGVVVAFNLIPAFPLDGGRVLRSILWYLKGNLRWATRITASIGASFGMFLILLGVLSFVGGNVVGGLWQFLVGTFLRSAAQMSYQQVLVRRALEGETVDRFMHSPVLSVAPAVNLEELVEQYIYRHHHKLYPVVDDQRLRGCITLQDVKSVPRDQWSQRTVGDLAQPCGPRNTIESGTDALQALSCMSQHGASRLLVVRGDQLVGIVTLKDLLKFIALKVELEAEGGN